MQGPSVFPKHSPGSGSRWLLMSTVANAAMSEREPRPGDCHSPRICYTVLDYSCEPEKQNKSRIRIKSLLSSRSVCTWTGAGSLRFVTNTSPQVDEGHRSIVPINSSLVNRTRLKRFWKTSSIKPQYESALATGTMVRQISQTWQRHRPRDPDRPTLNSPTSYLKFCVSNLVLRRGRCGSM